MAIKRSSRLRQHIPRLKRFVLEMMNKYPWAPGLRGLDLWNLVCIKGKLLWFNSFFLRLFSLGGPSYLQNILKLISTCAKWAGAFFVLAFLPYLELSLVNILHTCTLSMLSDFKKSPANKYSLGWLYQSCESQHVPFLCSSSVSPFLGIDQAYVILELCTLLFIWYISWNILPAGSTIQFYLSVRHKTWTSKLNFYLDYKKKKASTYDDQTSYVGCLWKVLHHTTNF